LKPFLIQIVHPKKKKYLGIVNLFELFIPLAFKPYFESSLTDSEYFNPNNFNTQRLQNPVSDWIGTSEEGATLWAANSHDSVFSLIEKMAKGVHRYLIEGRHDGKPSHQILTQSDLIRFISTHRKQLGAILSLKLSEISLPKASSLKTLPSNFTVVEGLREMYRENLPSLGVVDTETSVLIGNFSLSDLRGIQIDNLSTLLLPLKDFLQKIRQGAGRKEVISCPKDHTVEQAIDIMLTEGVHRVWILDEDQKPETVCTMSNINYLFF